MVELYFIVMSVSAVVLAGALSVILYLDQPPQSRFPTTLRNQISKRGTDSGLGQPSGPFIGCLCRTSSRITKLPGIPKNMYTRYVRNPFQRSPRLRFLPIREH